MHCIFLHLVCFDPLALSKNCWFFVHGKVSLPLIMVRGNATQPFWISHNTSSRNTLARSTNDRLFIQHPKRISCTNLFITFLLAISVSIKNLYTVRNYPSLTYLTLIITAIVLVVVFAVVFVPGAAYRRYFEHRLVRDHRRIVRWTDLRIRHRIVPGLDFGRAEELEHQVAADGHRRANAEHVQPLVEILL